jgi:ADP-heptose:LPS heptosyltransferase
VHEFKRQTVVPVKKLAVFMNGCANPNKKHTKDPGSEIYQYIQGKLKGYKTIFVGGDIDTTYGRYDKIMLGDIQLAITLISKADIIISNDTGLYHAAGAMRKKGFILWKDTLFTKNNTPNDNFFRSRKGNWKEDFDTWIEEV